MNLHKIIVLNLYRQAGYNIAFSNENDYHYFVLSRATRSKKNINQISRSF
jgi:hypothetical protein